MPKDEGPIPYELRELIIKEMAEKEDTAMMGHLLDKVKGLEEQEKEVRRRMATERRVAKLKMTFGFLADILKGNVRPFVETNAPQDLEIVAIESQFDLAFRQVVMVYCRSASFDIVPDAEEVPEIPPFEYQVDRELERAAREIIGRK